MESSDQTATVSAQIVTDEFEEPQDIALVTDQQPERSEGPEEESKHEVVHDVAIAEKFSNISLNPILISPNDIRLRSHEEQENLITKELNPQQLQVGDIYIEQLYRLFGK